MTRVVGLGGSLGNCFSVGFFVWYSVTIKIAQFVRNSMT